MFQFLCFSHTNAGLSFALFYTMNKLKIKIALFTLMLFLFCNCLFSQYLNSCSSLIDSLNNEHNGSAEMSSVEKYHPKRWKYFVSGLSAGYFDNIDSELLTLGFYLSRLWQVNDVLSLGISGEFMTEFEKTILTDVSFSSIYYPFFSSVTPFAGVNLGPGFLHFKEGNRLILYSSFELGAIIPEIFPFVLMVSVRLNVLFNRSFPAPLIYTLRAGAAF